jgi:hypothetical protein
MDNDKSNGISIYSDRVSAGRPAVAVWATIFVQGVNLMQMLTSTSRLICTLVLTACSWTTVAADAGSVQEMTGTVVIIGADNRTRPAGPRESIQAGDTLQTASRSEVLINMADDSKVVLRQNTRFQITEFKFDQKPTDSSIVSILRGTARMISGLIGKNTPSQVAIRASTATIGIRGTDFEVSVIAEDTPEARAGVYNYVHDGGTRIQIATGQSLEVRKEQTAFAPQNLQPGEEALQILRETPIFLQQGGGLDAIIQSIVIQPPPMIFR